MDILTERVKTVYFKYLRAAFGSALISSIYGVVDMAMVGQYHGSDGTAALAVVAPAIIRRYALSFLLLPFNIFSTYYFQAIMKPSVSFIVSVARGLVVSGILILLLPCVSGVDSIWFAMPLTELVVMLYAAAAMKKYTEALPEA